MTAPALSLAQARKHIGISLRVKEIASRCYPNCDIYIATYTAGRSGQSYQAIEEQSGLEFWSIRGLAHPTNERIKDPDVLITSDDQVKVLIEVKWGAIPQGLKTDMKAENKEWEDLRRLLGGPAKCRVRGPAVKACRRYRSEDFTIVRDFCVNDETKAIIVSDFGLMKQVLPTEYRAVTVGWRRAGTNILLADIHTQVDAIPLL